MSNPDWKAWPEDLPPRFNGGVRCDMFLGPCACGATHGATERLGQALQDAGLRAYLHKPGCDMNGGNCSMGCGREHHELCDVNDPIIKTKPCNCRGR